MYIKNMGNIKETRYNWKNFNITFDKNNNNITVTNIEYILSFSKLKDNNTYFTNARNLITPLNFDIFAKYLYVINKLNNYNNNFINKLYLKHIKSFNNFKEPDKSKNSQDDFINSFNNLIYKYSNKELDFTKFAFPISAQNILIDGSHRLSCAIINNDIINLKIFDTTDFVFDYLYFKKRKLNSKYLDYMALQTKNILPYANYKLVFYKNNKERRNIINKLYQKLDIYYIKNTKINVNNLNIILNSNYNHDYNKVLFIIYKDNILNNNIDNAFNLFLNKNTLKFINNISTNKLKNIVKKMPNLDKNFVYTYNNKLVKLNNIYCYNPKDIFYIQNYCFLKGCDFNENSNYYL